MIIGHISGVIDSLDFEPTGGSLPKIIHVSGTTYAIVYPGPGNDGFLSTIAIEADGTITGIIATLEFDTTFGIHPWIINVAGNVYAIAYVGPNNGTIKTVTIQPNGAISAVISTFVFDTGTSFIEPVLVHISGTTYAVFYGGPDNDGWVKTITIQDNGTITGTISSLEFDTAYGVYADPIYISGDVWAIAYTANVINGPGRLKTFTITGAGAISVITSYDYEANQSGAPDLFLIFGDVYGIAFGGPGADGWLITTVINPDGTLGGSIISSLEFDPDTGLNVWVTYIAGNIWCFAYDGPGGDGWLKTIKIENDGTITGEVDSFEYDSVDGKLQSMVHVSGNTYAIAYQGPGIDGWLKTVGIISSDKIYVFLGTVADPLKHEITADTAPRAMAARTERGKDDELGFAQSGIAELVCDNINGDFSPEKITGLYYPDLKLGAVIIVCEIYKGVEYNHFKGKLDKIVPHGEVENAVAYLTAIDGMDDMAGSEIDTPLRLNTETGVLVGDALDAVNWPVGERTLDAGVDPLPIGWAHKEKALDFVHRLEEMERGFFYISGVAKAVWENRHHRLIAPHTISQGVFDNTMVEFIYEYSKRQLYNWARLTGHTFFEQAAADALIWSIVTNYAGAPLVAAGKTLTLWADLDKPLKSYVVPVVNINFNANSAFDKTGVDLSAFVSISSIVAYGQAIEITFQNTGTQDAYLVVPNTPPGGAPADETALVYGKLYEEEYLKTIVKTDSTSINDYGKRTKEIDCPFKSNVNDLVAYAEWLIARYKDPIPTPIGAKFVARTNWPDDTIRIQCLSRNLSDRVTLKSTRLGVDADYYINKVIQEYLLHEGGMVHETTWLVERALGTAEGLFWLIGIAGFSELGVSTRLGF